MDTPVLQFENVAMFAGDHATPCCEGVSFDVSAGALVLVNVDDADVGVTLADVAVGIVVPESGLVRFKGDDWSVLSVPAAEKYRARIGRVFSGYGWLSNLDVDENVVLARHYHGDGDKDAMTRACSMAKRFGLEDLPRTRPAVTAPGLLRRSEWVRAVLGRPDLLVLESPLNGVESVWSEVWLNTVAEELKRGAAVLWIERDERAFERLSLLKPVAHYQSIHGRWHALPYGCDRKEI